MLFSILHYFVSLKYRANSWSGSLFFYDFFFPISIIISRYIAVIKLIKFRLIIGFMYLLIFVYLFFNLYPTLEDICIYGVNLN
jgi:hypothetical protein